MTPMDSCLLINHIKDTLKYSKRERRKMHAEGWNEKWEKKGQIKHVVGHKARKMLLSY